MIAAHQKPQSLQTLTIPNDLRFAAPGSTPETVPEDPTEQPGSTPLTAPPPLRRPEPSPTPETPPPLDPAKKFPTCHGQAA